MNNFCGQCGHPLPKESTFCSECGSKVENLEIQTVQDNRVGMLLQKYKLPIIVSAIILVIVLIIINISGGGSVETWEMVTIREYENGQLVYEDSYPPGEVILELHDNGEAIFIQGNNRFYATWSGNTLQEGEAPWQMEKKGNELRLVDEWGWESMDTGSMRIRVEQTFKRVK
jgi:predicted nucleic acid-binding Zn ribbon protein